MSGDAEQDYFADGVVEAITAVRDGATDCRVVWAEREQTVAVMCRGDRELNTVKLLNHFDALAVELADEARVKQATGAEVGFAGKETAIGDAIGLSLKRLRRDSFEVDGQAEPGEEAESHSSYAFGAVFAVNSSLHSYLILAFTHETRVTMDVGFYYMANAAGRLLGTVLSDLSYQVGGVPLCLATAAAMLAVSFFGASRLHTSQTSEANP